ncbi:hypothetical protein ACLB2K_021858 [Fragaria x ananassa]
MQIVFHYLTCSVERLNLKTWQWEALKNMPNRRAFAYGIAHKDRFFVVGDGSNAALKHSAEMYNPSNKSWRLLGLLPNQIAERPRLKAHGARMVPVVGKEVWVLVGENERVFRVDGSCAWPVFPAPMYKPNERHEVVSKGYICAFSFLGDRVSWRQIPVYSV